MNDPRVTTWTKTCSWAPEQYEGRLATGEVFYFRLKYGYASLGIGADLDAAIDDSHEWSWQSADRHMHEFPDEVTRDEVFTQLLDRRLRVEPR